MMFAGGNWAPAGKRLVQQMELRNRVHERPAPVGERLTAQTTYLETEKFDPPFVNAVIMWLDDSRLVLISELN